MLNISSPRCEELFKFQTISSNFQTKEILFGTSQKAEIILRKSHRIKDQIVGKPKLVHIWFPKKILTTGINYLDSFIREFLISCCRAVILKNLR